MKISYYHDFLKLAHVKNYLSASYELFLSQSTLSRHIQALEQELGVELFERNSWETRLTPEGERLIPYAEAICREYEKAVETLAFESVDANHRLTIGTQILSLEAYGLDRLFSDFERSCPEYKIDEVSRINDISQLSDFDLCLVRSLTLDQVEASNHLRIGEDHMVAILPKGHPLSRNESVKVEELKEENFLLPPSGTWLYSVSKELCRRAGFLPRSVHRGFTVDQNVKKAAAGIGVTLSVGEAVKAEYGKSVSVVKLDVDLPIYVDLVWRGDAASKPAKKAFVEFTSQYVRKIKTHG